MLHEVCQPILCQYIKLYYLKLSISFRSIFHLLKCNVNIGTVHRYRRLYSTLQVNPLNEYLPYNFLAPDK